MRQYAMYALVLATLIYAWRDWFVSLCILIVLMAFSKHPDMPSTFGGIAGLNVLNLLLLGITAAWAFHRFSAPQGRPVPRLLVYAAAGYALVIVVTGMRGYLDFGSLRLSSPAATTMTRGSFLMDFLGNPIKYLVVAALLFDGMRSRRNILLAIAAIVAQVTVFSLMAVRYIPIGTLWEAGSTGQFESVFRMRFQKRIGFHPNDAALALVAGFWTLAVCAPMLWRSGWRYRAAALFCGPVIALAIGLTNSRAGYMAMLALGLIFAVVRWRWMLVGIPLVALMIFFTVPGVQSRLGLGFAVQDPTGMTVSDMDEITAGRWNAIWPPTIEEIASAPVFGQGRMAILRTSVYDRICALNDGVCPTHPHNAYLEVLLDAGAVGLVIVLGLLLAVPVYLYKYRRRDIPILDAAACVGVAGAGTILVMGLTGQSFWPREAVNLVLCTYAVAMGAHVLGQQVPAALSWQRSGVSAGYASPAATAGARG